PVLSLSNIQQSHMVFSMDVVVGPSTEKVCISLTDVSNGQVLSTECFYADSDFDCCSFSFSNFDFSDATRLLIDPCKDYQVSVQVNNKCDANLATQSFLWNNDQTFSLLVLPNVITPNSDGDNDSWRVQATGVKRYEVEVRDNNQRVYFATDVVNSFEFRIWDGLCNQGWPACNVGSPCLSDGTYFYILKLIDCNNGIHDYTGFITLLDGTTNGCLNPRAPEESGNQQADINPAVESYLSLEEPETSPTLQVFPNPSDGRLTIVHDHLTGDIQVLDVSGLLVISAASTGSQTHLDLAFISNGHYLIKLQDEKGGIYFARWVKQ
ncbi:MAG: gliding motility-associated C-terminal domain-containing protein, partial [Flavobacteriales bacterium]